MVSKLISTKQLYDALKAKKHLYILDTTYTLQDITPIENHFKQRLPHSKFLDMKEISDRSSGLTLTMPTESDFIDTMRKLKVKNDNHLLVLYDLLNMTSPRAWFMFKVFGRENVSILDGGLTKWISEKLPIESGKYEIPQVKDSGEGYNYSKNTQLIKTYNDILNLSKDKSEQILDARPAKAFQGGKIPNSLNVPCDSVYKPDRTFKSPQELKELYEKNGIDFKKNVVHSCRIGHSASINLFAMSLAGKEGKLYDGSYEEWSKNHKASA